MNKVAKFYLEWFSADGDELVGQELLDVSEEEIIELFELLPLNLQVFDGLTVTASQRKQLQQKTEHKIDLNEFVYFVAYLTD